MGRVIIGVDPHKLSATIEVLDQRENVLGGGRFGTDRDGYRQMLTVGRRWPQRVWAVEGCNEGCRSGSPRRAAANPSRRRPHPSDTSRWSDDGGELLRSWDVYQALKDIENRPYGVGRYSP